MELQTAISKSIHALSRANPVVAVALSGGRDSVALLHATCALREIVPMQLRAIHIHHGLNPQANAWAEFCAQLCVKLGVAHSQIAVHVEHDNTSGVEAYARTARYQAFARANVDAILLAHHADDQIETAMHRLFRGAGLTGLAGMQATRPLTANTQLLRPWLKISRAKIEAYVAKNNLTWVEDNSNSNTAHTRNFLRHEVLPSLQPHFPQAKQAIARMAQHAHEHAQFAAALAAIDLGFKDVESACRCPKIGLLQGIDMMDIRALDSLPVPRQTNALYYFLHWQGISKFTHDELVTWAGLLFRPVQANRPNRAGGHEVVITRKRNGLWVKRVGLTE